MRYGWRDAAGVREVELEPLGSGRWRARIDGEALEVEVEEAGDGGLRLSAGGRTAIAEVTPSEGRRFVTLGGMDFVLDREAVGRRRAAGAQGAGLEAPMPGVVTRVLAAAGDAVRQGQPLVALEAMKMEHLIRAPRDGRVARVLAEPGQMVNGGAALVELEEEP